MKRKIMISIVVLNVALFSFIIMVMENGLFFAQEIFNEQQNLVELGAIKQEELVDYYQEVEKQKSINQRIDEQRQDILEQSIKEKGTPSADYYESNQSHDEISELNELQREQIEEIREESNLLGGTFLRQEKIIMGEIESDSKKLDLNTAREIISQNARFPDIVSEFEKIQNFPDFIGGSGVTLIEYWFGETDDSKIVIIVEQEEILCVTLTQIEYLFSNSN